LTAAVFGEPKNYPCGSCSCDADGRDPDGGTWTIAGVIEQSPICLRRLITQRSLFLFDLYGHYKRGVLPVAGGLFDQPHVYYRAMTVIDEWMKRAGKP
jgi:hypothetical protein